jgi:hypothetical protein
MCEALSIRLCKSATAATLFGVIALTPVSPSTTSAICPCSSRELAILAIDEDAGLYPEQLSAVSWTTHVRLGSTHINRESLRHSKSLDTVFELLKLAAHQRDAEGWRMRDELSPLHSQDQQAYHYHHLHLQTDRQGYEACKSHNYCPW